MKTTLAIFLLLATLLPAFAQTKRASKKSAPPPTKEEQAIDVSADPAAKVVFENDQTRVLHVHLDPNASSLLHRHPRDYILIAVGDIHTRAVWGRNEAREQQMSAGQMDVIKVPVVHQIINQSETPYDVLIVELKAGFHPENIVCGLGRRGCRAETGDLQDPSQQYSISMLFDTDAVRVFEITIGPGAHLPERTEKYAGLRIALADLTLQDTITGQPGARTIKQPRGNVQWFQPEGAHVFTNPTDREAHYYWIEFK